MLKLPLRLVTIARFIPKGSIVIDVGTDHGLLPIYLVKEGVANKVIASDINPGPLEAARKNVTAAQLTDVISLRLGNGLKVIEQGEADVGVIAGMGGATIREIIKDANPHLLNRLVLQPMGETGQLRVWLVDHGWKIKDEEIIKEDGRLYQIICTIPGSEQACDETVISVGPRLFEKKHPMLTDLINIEIEHNKKVISEMTKSVSCYAIDKRKELQQKTTRLERIVECLLNARQL